MTKRPEVLGKIDVSDPKLSTDPQSPETAWQTEAGGRVSLAEPPPPWEVSDSELPLSEARRFVDVPANWTLRWINPRLLDQFGWRDWQPVMASDPKVKVHVSSMVSPEGNVRRGGATGDILAWMYTSWVESRRRLLAEETDRLTRSSVEQQQQLKEDFRRGKYGPYMRIESATHPTHTMGEGRTMRD